VEDYGEFFIVIECLALLSVGKCRGGPCKVVEVYSVFLNLLKFCGVLLTVIEYFLVLWSSGLL